jgi:nitrogen regulatory protein P-II 1
VKRVEAIIRPFKLYDVTEALSELGINGLTSTDVTTSSQQNSEMRPGLEGGGESLPMSKLEIVAPDHLVGRVIEVIQQATKTGKAGDGRILVDPVELAMRVRTGERGEEAL